jgi:hypothetical protein
VIYYDANGEPLTGEEHRSRRVFVDIEDYRELEAKVAALEAMASRLSVPLYRPERCPECGHWADVLAARKSRHIVCDRCKKAWTRPGTAEPQDASR